MLDWNELARNLQVSHAPCKFLQVNHSTYKFLQVNHLLQETCIILQVNHPLQETWRTERDTFVLLKNLNANFFLCLKIPWCQFMRTSKSLSEQTKLYSQKMFDKCVRDGSFSELGAKTVG